MTIYMGDNGPLERVHQELQEQFRALKAVAENIERENAELRANLKEDRYCSKDWKQSDYAGRIEYLHCVLESSRKECDMWVDMMGKANDRIAKLEAVKDAAENILPPSHGLHGGPLVQMVAYYEDGSPRDGSRYRHDHATSGMFKSAFQLDGLRNALAALDAGDGEVNHHG